MRAKYSSDAAKSRAPNYQTLITRALVVGPLLFRLDAVYSRRASLSRARFDASTPAQQPYCFVSGGCSLCTSFIYLCAAHSLAGFHFRMIDSLQASRIFAFSLSLSLVFFFPLRTMPLVKAIAFQTRRSRKRALGSNGNAKFFSSIRIVVLPIRYREAFQRSILAMQTGPIIALQR